VDADDDDDDLISPEGFVEQCFAGQVKCQICLIGYGHWPTHTPLRVRVEIMESQKCRIVGKSQSVLIMMNIIIFTRTRTAPLIYALATLWWLTIQSLIPGWSWRPS
jgi:hypothetical protein